MRRGVFSPNPGLLPLLGILVSVAGRDVRRRGAVRRLCLLGIILTLPAARSADAATFLVCPSGCHSPTLQGAITMASAGDEIVLATSLPHTEADVVVVESVVIRGLSGLDAIVQAAASPGTAAARVFTIASGISVEIADMTIRNGVSSGNGGGIFNLGDLTLVRVDLEGHDAASLGGGIYNSGSLNLIDSSVMGSDARQGAGGGIYNAPGAQLEASDCFLGSNVALEGGNLFNAGEASLSQCQLHDGNASGLSMFNSGGGISNEGSLTLRAVSFTENRSAGFGGGFHQGAGETVLEGGVFRSNTAAHGAGAISLTGGVFAANDANLLFNTTVSEGGAVRIGDGAGSFLLTDVTLRDNEASLGGGLYIETSTVKLANVTLSGNTARRHGGGVYLAASKWLRLASATVVENVADSDSDGSGDGGGFYLDSNCSGFCLVTAVSLQNSIVANNQDASLTGRQAHECDGELTSDGYNLFGDVGNDALDECRVSGDLTGAATGIDPQLLPLADNGGPPPSAGEGPPWTHALLPWSPAIDAGDPDGCLDYDGNLLPRDQRHAARVGRCDIGAFELGGVPGAFFTDGFESGNTAAWSSSTP